MHYRTDCHSRKIRYLDRYNFFTAYANATYHFNSFNLLFKAVPNLVQNIAFERNIPVPSQGSFNTSGNEATVHDLNGRKLLLCHVSCHYVICAS